MALILDGTNGLSDVDGSAATPAIRGSDANTGVFFGTDIVGLSTGGSERVRVDASGNVGIGTSSPGQKLDVIGGTIYEQVQLGTNNTSSSAQRAGLNYRNFANTSNIALIHGADTAGTSAQIFVGGITKNPNTISFYTTGTYGVDGTERARITSSGELFVGASTLTGTLGVINAQGVLAEKYAIRSHVPATGSNGQIGFTNPNGLVGLITTSGSSTTYATSSDYRLKHDIQPMTGALAKVAQLKPCTYKWNADDSEDEGFIAHELAEVCPQAVSGEKDAVNEDGSIKPQGIDTSFLVATLTAAIQEQQAIITALTARVEALEGAQA